MEPNMGWSWLERWMATRQQENCLTDITKQYEPLNSNQRSVPRKRLLFDVAGEERERAVDPTKYLLNSIIFQSQHCQKRKMSSLTPCRTSSGLQAYQEAKPCHQAIIIQRRMSR